MISTSDLVILVVASGALAVGIYRWHENTQDVSAITIPASSRVVVEPINNTPNSSDASGETTLTAATSTELAPNPDTNPVVVQTVSDPEPLTGIVVTSTESSPASVSLGSHRVQSGDYLGKIAQQYGTDVQTLRDINGINGSIIQIGQEILYPL